jgi:hypothetical protein
VQLKKLVDPVARGHPESPLLWTAKSTAAWAKGFNKMGHQISDRSVATLLKENGDSLQAMRKTKEGGEHEDRDAQFALIAKAVKEHQEQGQPAVRIDAKKKVCHYPPGTSKWNKIEHRMFNHISMNWRGRALASRQIVVNLIGQTTTKAGLKIRAAFDEGIYPTGKRSPTKR